jgi:DNA mismatch repair protein MutH
MWKKLLLIVLKLNDGCRDKGWMKLMDEFELGVGSGKKILQNFLKNVIDHLECIKVHFEREKISYV